MKLNNLVKILIVAIIVLTIGLVTTSIKLLSMGKDVGNHGSVDVVDSTIGEVEEPIIEPVPDPVVLENEAEDDELVNNDPIKEEPVKGSLPKEEKPSKTEKPEKDNKPNNKDKDKKDKDKNNKGNDNKNNKNKNDKIIESKYISKDKAIEIGLKKVGKGAKLKKIKSELDDNPPKYELKIDVGKYKYELEIHAITGAVIDFEKDEK